MNSKLQRLTILLGSLLFSSSSWSFINCCPEPYVGLDAQLRHMTWSARSGNNVFNRNLPQGNLYLGLKINDYFGGEIGYETTFRRKKNLTLNTGGVFLSQDVIVEAGEHPFIRSKVEIKGFHANLLAYYPIFWDGLELIGSVGLVNLKLKHKFITLLADGSIVPDSLRTFAKQRVVPRLGLGIRQMIFECVGIRGMINWEKLSAFQNIPPFASESPTSPLRVDAKHSLIYSLGFFVNF